MHAGNPSAPADRQEAQTKSRSRCVAVAKAAGMLGIGQMTLYRAINAQQFPAIKFRDRWLVPVEAIDHLIETALASGGTVDIETWAESWIAAKRSAQGVSA